MPWKSNATQAYPNAMQPTATNKKINPQLAVIPSPLTNVPLTALKIAEIKAIKDNSKKKKVGGIK